MALNQEFNFDDVYYRSLTLCVLDLLEGKIKWINKFTSGDKEVNVPFYYSMTGNEDFLLDSFEDSIVSENRFVELNTDIIPRGHVTMTGFSIQSDQFANPNVWLRSMIENETEIRSVLAKVRAIPIVVNYDLVIRLKSEIDIFKASSAVMDTLWLYKYAYFEFNFMHIDMYLMVPDQNQIKINREKNLASDDTIELTLSFEAHTYYPAFEKNHVISPMKTKWYNNIIASKSKKG